MNSLSQKKEIRTLVVVLLLVIATVLLVQTFSRANRTDGNDLTSYLLSAKAILAGDNPYETGSPYPYIYPLLLATFLIPLTFLPYSIAVALWYFFSLGALGYTFKLILTTISPKPSNGFRWDWLLLTFFITVPLIGLIQNNLLNGQVNFIVLLLCVAFLRYFVLKKNTSAIIFLSAAAAIKLVPLIFLGFLILRRKFRDAILTVVLFLLFSLSPISFLGGKTFDYYSTYISKFLVGAMQHSDTVASSIKFSLGGLLEFVGLDFVGIPLVSALIVIAVLGWLDFKYLRAMPVHAFCLYLLSILLIVPMSETHHLAFVFPALSLVAYSSFSKENLFHRQSIITAAIIIMLALGIGLKLGLIVFCSLALLFWQIFALARQVKS